MSFGLGVGINVDLAVDRTVVVNNYNTNITRVSYNGGDGVRAVPTEEERSYASEPHLAMTAEQRTHMQSAQQNRNYLASVNQGHPADAAAAQPLSRENRPENFARINDADRASGMSMQSHVSRPQSQFRSFNRPQQRSYQQAPRQQHPAAPHPRSTGRPR